MSLFVAVTREVAWILAVGLLLTCLTMVIAVFECSPLLIAIAPAGTALAGLSAPLALAVVVVVDVAAYRPLCRLLGYA